ncbi:MAG: sirohydrochlorin chelatase [Bacillus sp. (in: Bacteria)]|nr:sirohydrochlorin chelatase [Bacillus sp. (in: firmicutes)]
MSAIVYIAHGSRRADANEKFSYFIKRVMQQSLATIQAYGLLENDQPTAAQAIETCVAKGAKEITVVPIFLSPGIHVNQDIPALFANFPDIVFCYSKPLGVDGIIVEILSTRLAEAGFEKRVDETVLLVGHGSREKAAAVEFENLAQCLAKKMGREVHIAYVTTPVFYHEMVEKLLDKRIFILPYFLFFGGYTVKMKKELARTDGDIVFCQPVGFEEKLIPLIEKRASEVEHERKLSDYVTA